MNTERNRTNWISVILYLFAGLMLALAVLLLIALIGAANALPANQIFFQMFGLGELANLILRPLQSALINAGIVAALLMTAIAALLFIAGRMNTAQTRLSERVRQLEERIASLKPE
ncbi:MAG: hypothetical protein AB1457_16720 [Chloroflexota bacterium]|nr:MAG: hypothetical protein KatS3mg045_0040 [Bellilinea sp.]